MPQTFANLVYYLIQGLTSVGFSQATATAIVNFGIQLAAAAALSSVYRKIKGVPDFSEAIEGTTITTRETLAHQRIVYGETLVSGPLWYINTAGENNRELHLGIILAGHEIEDSSDVWLDNNRIPSEYINGPAGNVTSGDFRGDVNYPPVAYFVTYKGNQVSAPSALVSKFTDINSAHIGKNLSWLHARFDYLENQTQVWSAGAPVNVKLLVKGKRVYDPRSDSTQMFGVGPHRVNSTATYEYSSNPALCLADYMIDDKLGFGESSSRIDYGYVASAANICDGIVYTPIGTDVRFSCDGVLSTGDSYESNIEKLLSSFNGEISLINGTWKIRAWGWETPTLSFTDDMARDDVQIKMHVDDAERFNVVRGYYVDPDRNWQANQFPAFSSSEYLARDNGRKLYKDVQLHMTKDNYMAQRIAAGLLDQSDNQATVVFPTNYQPLPAEVGGTVQYSNEKLGWTNKGFRVERYKLTSPGGMALVLREDGSDSYVDVATNEYTVVNSSGGYTKATPTIPAPSSMTADSRLEGILLKVTPPASRLYDYIRFYAGSANDRNQITQIARVKADNYLYPVQTQTIQHFWSRAEDYAGRLSDYYPNSNQTGIISGVSSAIALVFSESNTETTLSSDWNSAVSLVSAGVNPGGNFNWRADVTIETMLYHKAAMENTPAHMRVRYAVGTPQNWSTLGIIRDTTVNSVGAEWHTLKRSVQSNINTNHYFSLEAIADYSQTSEWIANSYSNITAKLVPQARVDTNKILKDSIMMMDSVVADYIIDPATMIASATNVSANASGFGPGGRVPSAGYAFTTITVSGGIPPYTYAWEKVSDADGADFTISNSGTSNPGWYGTRSDTAADNTEGWRVTVTDSGAVNSVQHTISVELEWTNLS